MTESRRTGHWRTNAQGTTSWVSEHSVHRVVYTLSKKGGQRFVNGGHLLKTHCKYCYKQVFFISLKNQTDVLFDSDQEPLILHNCQKENNQPKKTEEHLPAQKFLVGNNLIALDRRAEQLRNTVKERENGKQGPSEKKGSRAKQGSRAIEDLEISPESVQKSLTTNAYSRKTIKLALSLRLNQNYFSYLPFAIRYTGGELSKLAGENENIKLTKKQSSRCLRPANNLLHNLKTLLALKADTLDNDIIEVIPEINYLSNHLSKMITDFLEQQNLLGDEAKKLAKLKRRELKKENYIRDFTQRQEQKKHPKL